MKMTERQQQFLDHVRKACIRLDADQGIYFARELEQIDRTMYTTKRPQLEAEQLLPSRIQLPVGMDTHTWRLFDGTAEARESAGASTGVPMVDISAGEQTEKVQGWELGYGWSLDELDKARAVGRPLDSSRADLVRRGLAERLNYMALLGYAAKGIKGLFNLAGTLSYVVPADGTGAAQTAESKSADLCLRDLCGMVDAMPNNTLDIEGGANVRVRLLGPKSKLRTLSTKFFANTTDDVLTRFKRIRPNVELMGANYLDTAGASSAPRWVAYDPPQVSWLVCLPFQQMPVEQKGMRFDIACRAIGGGVFTQYPKSISYADGF